MATYKVNYEYLDNGVASVNLCDGPSLSWVKAWYTFHNKNVFEIHEAAEWEIREATDKGMPRTKVPDSFPEDVTNDRILKVLCDLVDEEGDDDPVLVDRVHEIMDAINEERI